IKYRRLDGKTQRNQRGSIIDAFQCTPEITALLISINMGGNGLNLTAASRVHIMEPQWNPMLELQALARVHRIGQDREVIATRYIMKDTIEEVFYNLDLSYRPSISDHEKKVNSVISKAESRPDQPLFGRTGDLQRNSAWIFDGKSFFQSVGRGFATDYSGSCTPQGQNDLFD
ncbi:P-loop containing nucleoside triphosphate hydrolase protein, partial [Kalaharituber pfeilii]